MFMISAIIILLGGISVTRLPVDLLPDVTYPTGQRVRSGILA
jgi:multidrug efflux pump subunit AcrB